MRRLLYASAVFAALIRASAADSFAEFPFEFREGLLWIDVSVRQSEKPLNFLVDSGAGCSVIDLSTAKRLGLKLGSEVSVRGVETNLTGYWLQRMSASAGKVRLPAKFLAVDLSKLSGSCERPVDGLLGANFFRKHIVQVDFEARMIRLLKPARSKTPGDMLPLRLSSSGMLVAICVNGREQWVRLDTGCATPLQWVTSDVDLEQCTRETAIGLAELSIPQTATTVILSRHRFENVPTGLHQRPIFPGEAGLLGNGLLSQFSSVTIDTRAGRLILEKRRLAQ